MDEYAGTDQESAGAGRHSRQGCVRRTLRQRHASMPCSSGTARDRARPAALRHVRSGQSRQEPGADPCRTCATSCTTSSSTSSGVKKAFYLGHSLGGQVVLGYALDLAGRGESLILEAPAGLEEYPREVAIAPGKTAKLFDAAFGARLRQVEADLGPDRHPGKRNRAFRAEHPRLLLLQEARSGDRRGVEGQERLLHERQRVCPLAYRAARRADQGQPEGARAMVERLHLRHLRHGGRAAEG